jgi:glycosyltransferase involved in cell wall biosynthesis
MHILFVVGKFPELTFIFRTITAIAAHGHRVTVAARKPGNWQHVEDQLPLPETLKVVYLLPDSDLRDTRALFKLSTGLLRHTMRSPLAAWRLWRQCGREPELRTDRLRKYIRYVPFSGIKADVIQFDFLMTEMIYPYLTTLLDAPTVISCRGSDIHTLEHKALGKANDRIESVLRATIVHCVSDEMATEVHRLTDRTEYVYVNRSAINFREIRDQLPNVADHVPLIIMVGRLTWIKGVDYLLAAFARLKAENVLFKAKIIGDGELYSFMRFSIEDLGLQDCVELCGRVSPSQVLNELQQADVFVLSSHEEGISNAALEAMSVGLPIVTTNAGGMAEAVTDGVEGFVVPVRDIPALADRMKRLLQDSALRLRMGQAARARIEADFTLERQVRVFDEIYAAARSRFQIASSHAAK